MTDRKKSTAGFWITVALIAVMVGYVLSIGPVFRVLKKVDHPEWMNEAYRLTYAPIFWICDNGPKPIDEAFNWYLGIMS